MQLDLAATDILSEDQALALADCDDTAKLAESARVLRDAHHHKIITYSRKVFIPLTHLCRDVCHYCTFAKTPKRIHQPFMSEEEALQLCRDGAQLGCQEALLTLGEKPELRYRAAREALAEMGFETTIDYVRSIAEKILTETGLLPHINGGTMTAEEIAQLRKVSASMGIMLESASARLCEKGMPHYGSPDKNPALRMETMELAGRAKVPLTTGILIGIGETRRERIESLLEIRRLHERHEHIQEVIIQNFRAKPGTKMSKAAEPDLNELLHTIAVARLIFGAQMSIQAPPNLSPGVLQQLVQAGINDWGGVSPLTPDHVNPEAPWPHLDKLTRETQAAGKFLEQRLTIYPSYLKNSDKWISADVLPAVLNMSDACGFAKRDDWKPGERNAAPELELNLIKQTPDLESVSDEIKDIVSSCVDQAPLECEAVTRLFESRGADFAYVTSQADIL
ncbi:MAG: 7,8-didemethyl-8-hydroxy-5-deazariboflavin synthase CofG, partial [Gammaproteobacteria bacterium]|nr:7,8-didemethyl-8-hydroxy-5-deazariboflavin synthase CofG [Gammaproteobacteria bacterium]